MLFSPNQGLSRNKAFFQVSVTVHTINCVNVRSTYHPTLTAVLRDCIWENSNSKKRRQLRETLAIHQPMIEESAPA